MPDALSARRLSRRGLLAAGGAATLATLLAACGKDDAAKPAAGNGSGPWSFTDDRGTKVEPAARPTRVVAFTGVAAALIDFGLDKQLVGVFGDTKRADGSADPQAGDLNVESVEILGNVWGEFSLEKYAALRPELLVTHMYDPDALWYVPDESKDKILPLAPSVASPPSRVPMTKPSSATRRWPSRSARTCPRRRSPTRKARFEAPPRRSGRRSRPTPGSR